MKFVYYLYRMIFISFFLVMLHVVVCGAPSIDLTLPIGDFRSSVRTVLFKGHVEDIDSLTLNGHPVEVYENRFYVKVGHTYLISTGMWKLVFAVLLSILNLQTLIPYRAIPLCQRCD